MEIHKILIRFRNEDMTAQEYITFSKKILRALKSYSDEFKSLYAWGTEAEQGTYLKEDLSDFDQVVFKQLNNNEIAYTNPDKTNKNFTLDSKSFVDYHNAYSTDKNYKNDQITVTISAGKENPEIDDYGILNIEFSESLLPKIEFIDFINLVEYCVDLIDPIYLVVISNELRREVNLSELNYWIGWINYFSDPAIAKVLPDDVERKIIPNKGVLFWLSKDKVFSTNDLEVQKAIEIRNILNKNGFLYLQ